MKLRQVPPMVAVVPAVAPWGVVAVAGAAGLLLIAMAGSDPSSVVFRLRLSGMAVAAAAAGLLDDPAAVTLAPSPVPLVARRSIRMAVLVVVVAVWWLVAAAVAGGAVGGDASALRRELAVLTAVAVLGSIGAQRWSADGLGAAAGALTAVGWFALSSFPRVGRVPLPPPPLHPGSAGPLTAIVIGAFALALLLSRDQAASRWRVRRAR